MRTIPVVGMAVPSGNGPSDFYRGSGPLSLLAREGLITIDRRDAWSWEGIAGLDVMFMLRPRSSDHLSIIRQANDLGVATWVDWDDDPFNIDPRNPAYAGFAGTDIQQVMARILDETDYLTVSTDHMRKSFETRTKRNSIRTIRNAWDSRMLPLQDPGRGKGIVWRGSIMHLADLYSVVGEYNSLLQSCDWQFIFMGMMPPFLDLEAAKRKPLLIGIQPLVLFFKHLRELRAGILVNPLADNDFNRSKSDIAFIEGCASGCAVVGPSMPEWDHPGVANYGAGDMARIVEALVADGSWREKLVSAGQEYLSGGRTVGQANLDRLEIIQCLLS